MNFRFTLIALIFFLVPEVSENLLVSVFDLPISSNTTENSDQRWSEEERETETVSTLFEDKTVVTGSSSGSADYAFIQNENQYILHFYPTSTSFGTEFWTICHKSPKYIQYCSLKIAC